MLSVQRNRNYSMQTTEELNNWYSTPDPWGYRTNPDDLFRRARIQVNCLPSKRLLDIGCGEGFITNTVPAIEKYGYDVPEALERLPSTIHRVNNLSELEPGFDLVLLTGVLYEQYPWREFIDQTKRLATKRILVAGVPAWLKKEKEELGRLVHREEIAYRDLGNIIEVYEVTS